MRRAEVVIIGAGTAGLGALREARKITENFIIVNDGPWGTICARVGCMPSKALIEAARAFHRRRDFAAFGVTGGERLGVDMPALLARVRKVRDAFVEDTRELTNDLGNRAISGRARLLGPNRVVVNGQDLAADRVVIATGSRPHVPRAWQALGDRLLMTTDTLFERSTLPKRIAVVGLGGVGAEMAQALARLGCEVEAFESKNALAGLTDGAIIATLRDALRAELAVHLGHEVDLKADGAGLRATAGDVEVNVDCALMALGRRPNLEGLGLETLGVPLGKDGRPAVDPDTLQVGALPVFLAGDVEGDRPCQHEAADEGRIAGHNARAEGVTSVRRRVPLRIVFTEPNVALVGKTYAELDPATRTVGEVTFAEQGRAVLGLRGDGRLHIYADKRTGHLLGAEMAAPDGEHLAHFLALAIERGCTVTELLRAPFYHPTLEEGLRSALRAAHREGTTRGEFELLPE